MIKLSGYLLLTLSVVSCSMYTTLAQPKQTSLTGTLKMKTGEVFPFKITLTDSSGIVRGYSFTYIEPGDTKATIRGTLDRHMRTLTFSEKEIIYSRNFHTRAFMCLIHASLKYNGHELRGLINSREADNTTCTPGEIIFSNAAELNDLFSHHEHFDTIISMKGRVKTAPGQESATAIQAPLVTEKITSGVEKTYEWHSDTVVIDAWDGGNVDGDRITLRFNGNALLTNYSLVKEKRQLRIPLPRDGVSTITILAENEGSDPPNTASLLFTDGAIQYSILSYNPRGMTSVIKIRRVK